MHVSNEAADAWLPEWFHHPARAELPTGHHLRPLRDADAGLPGVPARTVEAAGALAYGLFDDEERELLGGVTLAPSAPPHDAEVSWWVVPVLAGSEVALALASFVPGWVASAWPFVAPLLRS